ncbi:MAG: hypothetical protein V5A84_03545, partial [Planctomycetota bacterium]
MGTPQDRPPDPEKASAHTDPEVTGCFIVHDDITVPESVGAVTEDFPAVSPGEPPSSTASQALLLTAYAASAEHYRQVVRAVRSRPDLFLKPLLMLCRESNDSWSSCVDAELEVPHSPTAAEAALDRMQEIGEQVEAYRPLDDSTRASRLHEMLILRYMDSRPDRAIEPTPNPDLSDGYEYP